MLPSGDTDQRRDVAISRLTNSMYYYIDTCFIMDLSVIAQGKKRYRLLAFHEKEKKIFIDKLYRTLKGARIGFKRNFNDMAWSDKVTPQWTDLYQPDQDWIDHMLSVVENAECN